QRHNRSTPGQPPGSPAWRSRAAVSAESGRFGSSAAEGPYRAMALNGRGRSSRPVLKLEVEKRHGLVPHHNGNRVEEQGDRPGILPPFRLFQAWQEALAHCWPTHDGECNGKPRNVHRPQCHCELITEV